MTNNFCVKIRSILKMAVTFGCVSRQTKVAFDIIVFGLWTKWELGNWEIRFKIVTY